MNFTEHYDMFLSEEHALLRKTVRDFAEKEVAPHIREWDRSGAAAEGPETRKHIRPLLTRIGALRVVLSFHTGLNSLSLLQWGTEDQKQKYLVPQAQGVKLAAYCLTEPNS